MKGSIPMADPDPNTLKFIMSELRDVNKETRRTAVMKLGMMGGETAVRTLIHIVGDWNEDLIVRGRAAQMLGIMGDPRAVDPLIRALNAPGYQAQLHAAEALGKLGNARAVPPLLTVANDPSRDRVRTAARTALKQLGYEDAPLGAAIEVLPTPTDFDPAAPVLQEVEP
jgi:HEAT repeat protein